MPLYDFRCGVCDAPFETRVAYGEQPPCPVCGGKKTERVMTPFAGPFTVGMRGYAAKQSNDTRRVREEQRAERKAAREQRAKRD